MSDNRKLASDIRELDRGITDCENFLAKVLNRKVDSPRHVSANKKKNAPAKTNARPESRGRSQTRQRAPSASVGSVKDVSRSIHPIRKPASAAGSAKRISPEPNVKLKTNDGQYKRSVSVSRIAPQPCKCEPPKQTFNKSTHHVHLPQVVCPKQPTLQPAKPEPATQAMRNAETRNKNLSWGEILRGNHQPGCKADRGQWDIGGHHYSSSVNPSAQFSSYSTKVPHECEPIKECSSRSSDFTCMMPGKIFYKPPASRHHPTEESFSSEGTSGFSSNNDLPCNLTNKSIQCGSPIPRIRPKSGPCDHFENRRLSSSSSSGTSSQKVEEKDTNNSGILGSDVFTMFNPVRTLNFLVKELQGMLHKNPKEDASICRIIADMQKVLHRLPEGGEQIETSSGYTTRSKPHDSHSVTSASSHSYDAAEKPLDPDVERAAILRALEAVPALARRIDQRTESMKKKILDARPQVPLPIFTPVSHEVTTNSIDSIMRLQKYVEVSGGQLEIMCRTMEQTCETLKSEREKLKEEIHVKEKEISIAKSQEQDFVTTINSLRTNLESTSCRATQLSVENKLLKEQVKLLPSLQESDLKIKELTAELYVLREETKDLPTLRASQIESKILSERIAKLQEENKDIPVLKRIEEKYKQLSSENTRLKEENKAIPLLKQKEEIVENLTSTIEHLMEEKQNLESKITDLNHEVQKLKVEIQNQLGVAEATKRLTQRLQDIMKERDEAQHELHMLHIEREKLLILSRNKDEELSHFIKDILNIKDMVTNQLDNLKTNAPGMCSPMSPLSTSGSETEDMTTTATSHCQPVCSSPTSTTSGFPPVGEDWQEVSTILPEHTRSSPVILVSTKPKPTEESTLPFKSIEPDSWQNLAPVGQGEMCIREDIPPRPRTANPGFRPPIHSIDPAALGDNQWTGATVVTQQLHQNVQELFRLINTNSTTKSSSSSAVASCTNTTRTISSSLPSATAVTTATTTTVSTANGSPSTSTTSMPPPKAVGKLNRNFHFQIPVLPEPPQFLDKPEFSDFSSYHGSLAESSSIESIDAVLKELQKGDLKGKNE